ncbi:1-phosphofructokinase family hexose kinase [Phycicoccus sp. Soil748]|uniref:1-phosphofructokinase family hexose kinase n=1 Tax=Phycicoccus sp. Soil748 TaxID=1736397 RepID=UPI000B2FA9E1|nr:hexose kinase [Phycicoccus sp. Soil748]
MNVAPDEPGVVLTVTPNPALDVTYDVERLVPHASHRVLAVREVAGGKGLNVAGVLRCCAVPVLATGAVGGPAGEQLRADLDARGVTHRFARSCAPTRRTTTVVSLADGDATAFNEPGAAWPVEAWSALVQHVADLVDQHPVRVLVASGSLPPARSEGSHPGADGAPSFADHAYADLTRVAHDAGLPVVVDASRAALLGALAAGPDVVKPNVHELREATGVQDPLEGAKALQRKGARHVVVSLGAEGVLAVAPDGTVVRAGLGEHLRGNPTGAGDAAVAAIAAGLARGTAWDECLRDAVAWSAAAVLQPTAGVVDPADIDRLRAAVRVETTGS